MKRGAWSVVLAALGAAPSLAAQGTLEEAARRAQTAWLAHDPQALVGRSTALVLQIPGADPSSPLGRAQAVELLRRYLRPTEERALEVVAIRELEAGRAVVELQRRFVVAGTRDERLETLFLGFRRVSGAALRGDQWVLAEVRSAP